MTPMTMDRERMADLGNVNGGYLSLSDLQTEIKHF
jgi:hypothetical protein